MMRSLRLLPFLVLPLSAGCIAQVQYSPNPNILSEIGLEQGQVLMAQILTRVRQPRIFNVEVTPEWFLFEATGLHWGWHGHRVGSRMQVHFANIKNIDFYVNDRMMIYDLGGRRIAQLDMLNNADGLRFMDLVAAFQNMGGQWPGPANPAPPPEPPPAEHTYEPLEDEPEPTYRDDTPVYEDDPPPSHGADEEHTDNLLDED